MRVAVDWRSSSKENYEDYCKKYPNDKIDFAEWKAIIYTFNAMVVEHVLETGDKFKFSSGLGEFSINKKKKKKVKEVNGKEVINLPIDWQKTKQKGKVIYNFNYHTEGYSFKWIWFSDNARFKNHDLFYFRPTRVNSRLLTHYLKVDEKYQHMYVQWKPN